MTLPVRGMGGTWGMGVESTWGTAVARTNWKVMNSFGLARDRPKTPVPELGRLGQASSNPRFMYVEHDFAGGPFEFDACYDDSTILLLGHMLGAVATSGAGPFTHTVTLASPQPVGLTIEQIKGTATAAFTNTTEVFEGAKIATGRLYLTAGGIFTISGEVIAQTSGGLTTPGTPSYTAGERILHNHAAGVTIGAQARAVQSLTIDISRGLSRNHEIGSLFTSEPYENEEMSVTFELQTLMQVEAFHTALLADTQADLQIVFTGSGSNALTITGHNATIDEVSDATTSKGAIQQTIKGRFYADGSDQGLALAFVNANAQATAN